MTGVLDTNTVIGLAKGGVFDLLASVYSPLYVPPAVVREVVAQGQGRAGTSELQQALGAWITDAAPDPQTVQQFSAVREEADRQVLALAQDQAADHVLSSDAGLIRQAMGAGMTCLQVPDVVLLLKRRGLIPAVRPVLDQMRHRGFGIEEGLYQQTLAAAGE